MDSISVLFGFLAEGFNLLLVPGIELWPLGYTACIPFAVLIEPSQLTVLVDVLFLHIYVTFAYVVKVVSWQKEQE